MARQVFLERQQRWVDCDTPIGVGGQGSFCPIVGEPKFGVKFYKSMTPGLAFRLGEIVRRFVRDSRLAWPIDRVRLSPGDDVVGVLLERISGVTGLTIVDASMARRKGWNVTIPLRITIAREFVRAVMAGHRAGFRFEDINESNLIIAKRRWFQRTPRVALIDIDGSVRFSFRDPTTGRIGPSSAGVARPEYLPPEVLKLGPNVDLRKVDRTESHDIFAVAVLVWQLLMGVHPYAARNGSGTASPQVITEWIANGWWPWAPVTTMPGGWVPNPGVVRSFDRLPRPLREWFHKVFHDGSVDPSLRPDLSALVSALDRWLAAERCWRGLRWFRPWQGLKFILTAPLRGVMRIHRVIARRRSWWPQFDDVRLARWTVGIVFVAALAWATWGQEWHWPRWRGISWRWPAWTGLSASNDSMVTTDESGTFRLQPPVLTQPHYADAPDGWWELLTRTHDDTRNEIDVMPPAP